MSQVQSTPATASEHVRACTFCSGAGGSFEHRHGHPTLGDSYEWTVWVPCECRIDESFARRYPAIPLPHPRSAEVIPRNHRLIIVAPWDNFSRWLAPILYGAIRHPSPPRVINDESVTRAYVTEASSGGVAPLVAYEGLLILILGIASGNSATGEAVASAITAREYRPLWIYSPLQLEELPAKNFKWTLLEPLLGSFSKRTLP